MDPLSAASAFATIVGLIGQFRGERASSEEQSSFEEFREWLEDTQRSDINNLIDQQDKMIEGIKIILAEEREIFIEKLETINNALITYSSNIEGFSQIAESINPNLSLSDQAISVLTQFEEAEASKVLENLDQSGVNLIFIDGKGGVIEITEQRFLEDDISKLVNLGLLLHRYNSNGKNLYTYTREASSLVKTMKINSQPVA